MPPMFSDNMILQRGMPVKIWGKSSANAQIEVEFDGSKKSVKSDADGNWNIFLPSLKGDKQGKDFLVRENGIERKLFKNVVVGEVFLLSGQSNMEYNVKGYGKAHFDSKEILKRANNKNMRIYRGKWKCADEKIIENFSVLGFHFGEYIQEDLDVPVGFAQIAMGGAAMIAFIPKDEMNKVPYLKEDLKKWEKSMQDFNYEKAKAAYNERVKKYKEDVAAKRPAKPVSWTESPSRNSSRPSQFTPEAIYGAIKNFSGYTIRAILWYQGESDAETNSVENFSDQLKLMVNRWRTDWDQNVPFYQVMLTSFNTRANWIRARAEQMKASKTENYGIVNILDLGDKYDIHPQRKQEVAKRLEQVVLRDLFSHKEIPQNFVTYNKGKFDGGKVELTLCQNGKNSTITLNGELRGVELMTVNNEKEEWNAPAFHELKGNKLILRSADNKEIKGVRYLWKNWAQDDVSLWLAPEMPLFPFQVLK